MHELEISSVMHTFGMKKLLSDVYLKVQTGEIIGLLGRNGSGKTTLMNIIFGILKPDSRIIRFDGQYFKRLYTEKNTISFLPQHTFIPRDLSVEKAITLMGETTGITHRISENRIINSLLKKKIRELSDGELRFLEIFLILESDSEFSLLDEPFTGLAPIYQEQIQEKIKMTGKRKGLIITDHMYRNVLDICDKIVLLKNGMTIEIKDKSQLIEFEYLPSGKA
ncbi:ATP-binding cassette domain-containing protein [Candidatus Latescibacterota bacterium]